MVKEPHSYAGSWAAREEFKSEIRADILTAIIWNMVDDNTQDIDYSRFDNKELDRLLGVQKKLNFRWFRWFYDRPDVADPQNGVCDRILDDWRAGYVNLDAQLLWYRAIDIELTKRPGCDLEMGSK